MHSETPLHPALLRAVVETSYDMVCVLTEDGTILYESPSLTRVLGFEPQDRVGTNLFALVHPEDFPRFQQEFMKALSQGRGEVSAYRYRSATGEWRWLESVGALLTQEPDPQEPHLRTLAITSRDVTESKQAHDALEKTNREIVTIWESMTDAFFAVDAQWRFTYLNAQGERLLQRRREELIGQNLWEKFPDALHLPYFTQCQKAVTEQVAVAFTEYYPPLNTWFEVHAYPSAVGLSVYFRDVGERVRTEHQLRLRSQLLDVVGQAVIVTDIKGVITYWNDYASHLYGWSAEEAIGLNITEVTVPQATQEQAAEMMARLTQGESWSSEFRVQRRDGSTFPAFVTNTPIRDESGAVTGMISLSDDISPRQRVKEAVVQSESNFRSIFEAVPDGIVIHDNGRLINANPAYLEMIGYPLSEIVGHSLWDLVAPESLAEAQARVSAQSTQRYVVVNLRRDGTRFHSEIVAKPYFYEGRQVRLAVIRDITEQKQNEAALQESEERFRQMAENISEVVWMSNPQTSQILYVNPAYEHIWGRSCQSLYDDPISFVEAIHPDDREVALEAIKQKAHTGRLNNQYRVVRPDGSVCWIWDRAFPIINPDGEVTRIVGIAQDITESKRMEKLLQSERDFSEAVLDTVGSLVIVLDPQGRVVRFNRACEQLTGYTFEECKGKYIMDVVLAPEEAQSVKGVFADITQGQFPNHYENVWVTKDGNRRLIAWSNTALVDGKGNVEYVIGTGIDITERRQIEAALQQTHDELELRVQERTTELAQTNKTLHAEVIERQMVMGTLRETVTALERAREEAEEAREAAEQARQNAEFANRSKSEFLSRMSHELRTPLNAILGFGQILEMQPGLTHRQQGGIEQIIKAGRHLLGLINEVLDIARVEAGRLDVALEPIRLQEIIQESLSLVRPLAEQQEIQLPTGEDLASHFTVQADRQRLRQVLINLLSNAIKYNRPGGTVSISCQEVATDRVQIRVTDTGHGIAPEDLKRLFMPFERLEPMNNAVEGTGLGLALSQRLVEAMNGTIHVESQPGQGSSFWIELPRVPEPVPSRLPSVQPLPEMPEAGTGHACTILCIEDHPANFQLIEAIFEDRPGVRLLHAEQGQSGLDLARQHHPDIILLDLHLPDISGEEVLRRLRAAAGTQAIPVVVMSADATTPRIQRLLEAGSQAYLTKPLNVPELLKVVDDML